MFGGLFGRKKKEESLVKYNEYNADMDKISDIDQLYAADESILKKFAEAISNEDKSAIRSLMEQGRKIEAIKMIRDITGAGLKEAKDMAEDYNRYL
jgi:ribosomal protein L7/L12